MYNYNYNYNSNYNPRKKGFPFMAMLIAVAVVFVLSLIPWGDLTGNYLKDYNLFSDMLPADSITAGSIACGEDMVDPELEEAAKHPEEIALVSVAVTDTATASTDSVMAAPQAIDVWQADADKAAPSLASRVGGDMVLEDYTPGGNGLRRFKSALASGRPARVAVIGDSYIEGDIFTQDLRQQLQNLYGGSGVGYVPANSIVAGFRRTVSQKGSGWTQHAMKNSKGSKYPTLAGEYFSSVYHASASYNGNAKDKRLANWDNSRLLFVAPEPGKIEITTDNGTQEYQVSASPDVQQILIPGTTSTLKINSYVPNLVSLGSWLEGSKGVMVDCMSMRGVSGVANRNLDVNLARQMRQYVDYDLIIVEYGINALNAKQTDYDYYGKMMTQVLMRIKECYPNADVIMMGIGDRGEKVNGQVRSMITAPYMVDAQRKAAHSAQVLFWDTREAMGGEDAIVAWRESKLVNGDYIHLNSQGGQRLATELMNSIKKKLDE